MKSPSKALGTAAKRPAVAVPRMSEAVFGPQGQRLFPTVTQATCGTTRLSGCTVVMPPGRVARAHLHHHTDSIVIVAEGYAATLMGEEFEPLLHGPGEFLFIPEGVVHAAVNLSPTSRLIAFEVRTDPLFNDDVVPTPEHQAECERIASDLQQRFAAGTLDLPAHWDLTDPGAAARAVAPR